MVRIGRVGNVVRHRDGCVFAWALSLANFFLFKFIQVLFHLTGIYALFEFIITADGKRIRLDFVWARFRSRLHPRSLSPSLSRSRNSFSSECFREYFHAF